MTELGRSFWDGRTRVVLRVGLAITGLANLVSIALRVAQDHAGPQAHPLAPAWLTGLGGHPLAWLVALVAAVGFVQFMRKPGQWLAGGVALAGMALLVEVNAACNDGPMRHYFAPGLALWGWLAGLLFARMLGGTARAHGPWLERHAEMGAVAALGANYVDAVISKMRHVGPDWADATTLRAIVLSHHTIDDASWSGQYTAWVGHSPEVAHALSVATLVVQGSACLLVLGGWVRLLAGLAIVAFHTNVQMLAEIGYAPARAMLLLLCVPWPQLVPLRWRAHPWLVCLFGPALDAHAPPVTRARLWTVVAVSIAGAVAAVALAQTLDLAHYASYHHGHNSQRADVGQFPGASR